MLGIETIKNFLRGPGGQPIPTEDIAYVSNGLFLNASFHMYNPDDLLTRKGFSVYKKMMTDEQVKAVVRFHRDAVTGREWSFEDNPELSEAENEKRRRVLEGIIAKVPGSFKTRLDMVMSSLYNGFSLVEKTFELVEIDGKQWVGIKSLKLKPFDTFYFSLDEYGNLKKLEQIVDQYRKEMDLKKFIHHVCNPDVHEYYGQSELRECYRAWWSKDTTLLLQNIFLERSAAGFTWAQPKQGTTLTRASQEYSALTEVISKIRSNSSILLPSNIELNVVHPSDTQAFERAVIGHDKAIAKALLMPNLLGLSEQGPNGSRALGDTQLEAFLWMLDAEAKNLQEVLNEQLFAELAQHNFPDGLFPSFKLHELSDSKMMEIVDKWVALVNGGAVKPLSADEQHLRSALSFPPPEKDEDEAEPVNPQTALSGIQVQSMIGVVSAVAKGEIPRETGVQILLQSFPITLEQAEEIMGSVGKGFEPKAQPQQPGGDPSLPSDEDNPDSSGGPREGDPDTTGKQPSDGPPEETLLPNGGRQRIEAKMQAARNRVAFTVIDKKSQDIEAESIEVLSTTLTALVQPITDRLGAMEAVTPDEIKALKFDSKQLSKVRNQVKAMLTKSWALGLKHAKDEISKARGEIMSASFARLDEEAAAFFDAKSFTVAGKLTNDMKAIMENILLEAIKNGQGTKATVDQIYETFASQGYITPEDAQAAMQGILQAAEGATARLNTVVRTNTFEAVNEARYTYFTDPELGDFVEALEYSAILDSRTTQICRHLDGQVHSATGEVWNGPWRPPNHYNCRSLLIPLTEFDKWSEDPLPDMMPQEGFGGRNG